MSLKREACVDQHCFSVWKCFHCSCWPAVTRGLEKQHSCVILCNQSNLNHYFYSASSHSIQLVCFRYEYKEQRCFSQKREINYLNLFTVGTLQSPQVIISVYHDTLNNVTRVLRAESGGKLRFRKQLWRLPLSGVGFYLFKAIVLGVFFLPLTHFSLLIVFFSRLRHSIVAIRVSSRRVISRGNQTHSITFRWTVSSSVVLGLVVQKMKPGQKLSFMK